jgi:hypothetical protein
VKTRLVSLGARLTSGQSFGAIHAPAVIAEAIPQTLHEPRARASMARGVSMTKSLIATSISGPASTRFAAGLALLAAMALIVSGASPARADRCDDLAAQLKSQIDGLAVGKTAANLIYLSHPQAKQITLGCASRNVTNQLFARAESRKPTPAFLDLVASATAIIFTLPKDDMLKGATRCIKRMGLFHGDDVATRYRRLDMRCARTKTEASITISRGTEE